MIIGVAAMALFAVVAVLGLVAVLLLPLGLSAGAETGSEPEATPATVDGIPDETLRLYVAAARTCPGLSWTVLAAVGKIETDHGRSRLPGVTSGTNYAGAAGPMQFLIPTWGGAPKIKIGSPFTGYATDGDGDGWADIYNPADAIYGAAKYLCSSEAATDVRKALFAYNHSDAYVNSVLAVAKDYQAKAAPTATAPSAGALAPERPGGPDNITPRMRTVRDLVKQQFSPRYGIGCYRANGGIAGGGEHPLGRACDFMLSTGGRIPAPGEQARGDAIAAWAQTNAERLGILYVIWRQRIWNVTRAGEGWRPMADRGSHTANHQDHVHISMR
ncbi:lytic transglycosylase domain-containing protein (plasmid) [Streptosporangium sp. CA-135522]|uniref:lytic transglycosylase domain-containing protein n=1 Tax=Streptosporangium sp. CA-135522 TaxID=3240072 RepID=UPI003D913ECA